MTKTSARYRAVIAAGFALAILGSGCEPLLAAQRLSGSTTGGSITLTPPQRATTTSTTPASTTTSAVIATTTTSTPATSTTTSTTSTSTTTSTTAVPATVEPASRCESAGSGGPSQAPTGAVIVRPGDSPASVTDAHPGGTTYWFTPGTFTMTAPIVVEQGDRFIGAPGAELDGAFNTPTAFTGGGANATIEHLVIQRFGTADGTGGVNASPINRSVASGWTLTDNMIRLNDGNAVFAGFDATIIGNCLDSNGQTGIAAPAQKRDGRYVSLTGITIADNEVRNNNRGDLEHHGGCQGCTAGMKLWQTTGAVVTGNNVHDNHGVGIWLDNNNVDALVDANTVSSNDREGIMVETSYNSMISNNVVSHNGIVAGLGRTDAFPIAGIFISNSGGSPLLAGAASIEVTGNTLTDNFNGVVVFNDSNRSCASTTDTSIGHCTLTGGTQKMCADDLAAATDQLGVVTHCHWATRSVSVHHNSFVASTEFSASCPTRCNRNAAIATTAASTVSVRLTSGAIGAVSNPLPANWAQALVADPHINTFATNSYVGSWHFNAVTTSTALDIGQWRALGQN